MHPPHLHQSTTLPVRKLTYQTYHLARFTVPPTVPTLQPPYISGGYWEMHPEQLPPIPLIEPPLLPYYAQSILPHTTVLLSTQSEFHPVVSSTAAYRMASTASVPSLQSSTHSGSLDTLLHSLQHLHIPPTLICLCRVSKRTVYLCSYIDCTILLFAFSYNRWIVCWTVSNDILHSCRITTAQEGMPCS